jgi:hypothetical protein
MPFIEPVAAVLVVALLIFLMVIVTVRMATGPGRSQGKASQETVRADRAEKAIHDVLVYADGVADVEPVARVVVDTLKESGYTK